MKTATKSLRANEKLVLRRTENKKVTYQWFITPDAANKVVNKLELGVTPNDKPTNDKFEKWFENSISSIKLSHKGEIGSTLRLAVKADLSKLDTSKLIAYRYNPETNSYKRMNKANIVVDINGYVHIDVTEGGAIILADKPLVRK